MMRRYIHYEAAFEDYLRSCGRPYVAVDDHRRAIFSGTQVKSFDFVVYRADGRAWLVDVKGRKFPYDRDGQKRYWENWITREDLDGLTRWEQAFGEGFVAVLVFAYLLLDPGLRLSKDYAHPFRNKHYAFMCIGLDEYRRACRPRSPKWDTLTMPAVRFRKLARPIQLV